jgi:hypothetical protein
MSWAQISYRLASKVWQDLKTAERGSEADKLNHLLVSGMVPAPAQL